MRFSLYGVHLFTASEHARLLAVYKLGKVPPAPAADDPAQGDSDDGDALDGV